MLDPSYFRTVGTVDTDTSGKEERQFRIFYHVYDRARVRRAIAQFQRCMFSRLNTISVGLNLLGLAGKVRGWWVYVHTFGCPRVEGIGVVTVTPEWSVQPERAAKWPRR